MLLCGQACELDARKEEKDLRWNTWLLFAYLRECRHRRAAVLPLAGACRPARRRLGAGASEQASLGRLREAVASEPAALDLRLGQDDPELLQGWRRPRGRRPREGGRRAVVAV